MKKKKRHPTVDNNVVIGSNAILLGAITVRDNAIVGAAPIVTHDVPPNTTAVGVPAKISLGHNAEEVKKLDHSKLPDPVADAMKFVLEEQKKLEQNMYEKYKRLEEKINAAEKLEQRK
ncbi:MAG: hypothetical protein LBS81_05700 [Endomicrobium sp.]|nr:hypothetical protein [Endomicrobium sp.]